MREQIENSIISCYLKIADAIAEGSSSQAKMNRAFKSIMKKGKKAVASARTSRDADRVKDKVADKLAPVVARGAAKQKIVTGKHLPSLLTIVNYQICTILWVSNITIIRV